MLAMRLKTGVLAAACALAAVTSGCVPRSKPDAHNEDVVVCRDEPPTGSHISRPVCYRRAQIEERGENDREKLRRLQQQSQIKPPTRPP